MNPKTLRNAILAVKPFITSDTGVTLNRADGVLLVAAGSPVSGACVELADPGDAFDLAVNQPGFLTKLLTAAPEEITLSAGRATLTMAADAWTVTLPTLIGNLRAPPVAEAWTPIPPALRRAAYCIAPDDSRYKLCGLQIEHTGTALRAVATDGNRLCWSEAPGDPLPAFVGLIPRALVGNMTEIATVGTTALTRTGNVTMWARLLTQFNSVTKQAESPFPDYRQVLPKATAWTIAADRDALLAALRKVGAVSSRSTYDSATYTVADGRLSIAAKVVDYGAVSVALPVDVTGTPPHKWGLRTSFLADALRTLPKGIVHLSGSRELEPVLVTSPGDASIFNVVMPVRMD